MTGPDEIQAQVESAASALRTRIEARLGGETPGVAITMGSGLGGLGAEIEDPLRVPYEELPGWPRPTVIGHAAHALVGTLCGRPVLGLSGRVHLYEGGPPSRVAFYVRVAAALGIPALFLSNAAGAIRAGWHPGELMLISDHLNLTGTSPLIGPVVGAENRFPDLTFAYDRGLRTIVRGTAAELGQTLHEGVYAAMHGPAFETPAEIRMLRTLGADAVGMSTVPEVITARALGIRCVAVSCLTNYAAGVLDEPLNHEEVLETTKLAQTGFQRLVAQSIASFP
ncbi:purine-nucleoside phosphorylase [Candidatus Palauibacter sp.]|uniref:purine-nucleoside phosphorylase n=1 Tax=Candidatus Palauibacter sp. TaxID=3101350 RepID=UPI003B01E83D